MSKLHELMDACRTATEKRIAAAKLAQRARDDGDDLEKQYRLRLKEEADAYATLQAVVKSAAEDGKEIRT